MATCPMCRAQSPSGAEVCGECRAYRFPVPAGMTPATVTGSRLRQAVEATIAEQEPGSVPDPAPTPVSSSRSSSRTASRSVAALRLLVIRGLRVGTEYPIYDGANTLGRMADRPVEIDLTGQEPADQVWSSRRHATVTLDRGVLVIEDRNSLNGTFINHTRLLPGQKVILQPGDVIAVGTVHLKVVV